MRAGACRPVQHHAVTHDRPSRCVSAALLHALSELEDMRHTAKGSLRRRFVSEYVTHIALRDDSLRGESRKLQDDLQPYLIRAKQSFGDVPHDAFQRHIASLVAYLVRVWEADTAKVTSEVPRHPSVRRVYEKRRELYLALVEQAKSYAARRRYGQGPTARRVASRL